VSDAEVPNPEREGSGHVSANEPLSPWPCTISPTACAIHDVAYGRSPFLLPLGVFSLTGWWNVVFG